LLRTTADDIAATHIELSGEEKKYIDEVYEPLPVVSLLIWALDKLIG
jgi:hypothetical protein